MGVCSFCGDETTNVSRPMAGHMRNWAHRNAQRDHTHREILIMPSSGYPISMIEISAKSFLLADISGELYTVILYSSILLSATIAARSATSFSCTSLGACS
jgi:hypothetical protein